MLNRSSNLRRSPIRRVGPKSTLWEDFAAKYAQECRDRSVDGLIGCEASVHEAGCERRLYRPDLHHLESRDAAPALYFHKPNLIWLSRPCHSKLHP